jgi:hypothetical protein
VPAKLYGRGRARIDDQTTVGEVGQVDLLGGMLGLEDGLEDGLGGRGMGLGFEQELDACRGHSFDSFEAHDEAGHEAQFHLHGVQVISGLAKQRALVGDLAEGLSELFVVPGAQRGDGLLDLGTELVKLSSSREDGGADFGGAGGSAFDGLFNQGGFLAEVLDFSNKVLHGGEGVCGLRVCAKITSDFGGSAAGPAARREEGSVSIDTRPTEQRSRWPGAAPPRWAGGFGRAGIVAPRSQTARVCSLLAPRQPAQFPPAKLELIFAQTLRRRVGLLGKRRGWLGRALGIRQDLVEPIEELAFVGEHFFGELELDGALSDAGGEQFLGGAEVVALLAGDVFEGGRPGRPRLNWRGGRRGGAASWVATWDRRSWPTTRPGYELVAAEGLFDFVPAGFPRGSGPADEFLELEQIGLGAGGEGLGFAAVVVEDEGATSSSFMMGTTFSARRFMLR